MANPFQDQFLKAGLTDKNKVEKARRKQRKSSSEKARDRSGQPDVAQQQLQQANAQKADRDRRLNRQKQQQADEKAITAQIRQLIEMNTIEPVMDGVVFRFEEDGIIKRMEVDETTRQQLVSGRLCIARFGDACVVIPHPVAEKITQRNASYIVLANTLSDEAADESDDYAEFQVPDDLMW